MSPIAYTSDECELAVCYMKRSYSLPTLINIEESSSTVPNKINKFSHKRPNIIDTTTCHRRVRSQGFSLALEIAHESTNPLVVDEQAGKYILDVVEMDEINNLVPPIEADNMSNSSTNADRTITMPSGKVVRVVEETTTLPLEEIGEKQRKVLQELIDSNRWGELIKLVEQYPEIARLQVKMVCQGEPCTVTVLHEAAVRAPVSILESLVTVYPGALKHKDSRRGRLPLHLALLKKSSEAVITYLLSAWPGATKQVDSDGMLPLHYAISYSTDTIVMQVLNANTKAAAHVTNRHRTALHVIASRNELSSDTFKSVLDAYPEAQQIRDLQGRIPLHLAAWQPYPVCNVLQILCDGYPEAVLQTDEQHKTPLQLLKRLAGHGNLAFALLRDRTNEERRKQNIFLKLFPSTTRRIRSSSDPNNNNNTIGNTNGNVDLMNCYG